MDTRRWSAFARTGFMRDFAADTNGQLLGGED
jgi:hypothetical protein